MPSQLFVSLGISHPRQKGCKNVLRSSKRPCWPLALRTGSSLIFFVLAYAAPSTSFSGKSQVSLAMMISSKEFYTIAKVEV
jgi:hypothetical protein